MVKIKIKGDSISIELLRKFINENVRVEVARGAMAKVKKTRAFVERKLKSSEPFYGINTGFGMLANKRISEKDLDRLQENLVLSHAVGVGSPFPVPIARLMMLLRANVLAKGYSGVRPETLGLLVEMINKDVVPVIPEKGSVGASGDLAPLAHIALAMMGRGNVFYRGKILSAAAALRKAGLEAVKFSAKEGIALVNGTQGMLACAVFALSRLENLLPAADIAGAMAIEGDRASRRPFDPRLARLRPHPGQIATAANVRRLIAGSRLIASHAHCKRVQDAYSFRCIPQVHGAVKDMTAFARTVIEREIGSSTDNPMIFADDDEIISGGNFHGEPLAIAMDALAIAVSELGSISERRVAILTAPLDAEIPVRFLVPHPGLNSGFMVPHVVMSALVSENKVLSHPASVDSIPTSGGLEDHVSMGLISARKLLTIIENVETILAIEILAAASAIDLQQRHGSPGKGTGAVWRLVRKNIPKIEADREFRLDIEKSLSLLREGSIVKAALGACGRLTAFP